eukprot:640603-Pelagomonas_calceolata.AAC.1
MQARRTFIKVKGLSRPNSPDDARSDDDGQTSQPPSQVSCAIDDDGNNGSDDQEREHPDSTRFVRGLPAPANRKIRIIHHTKSGRAFAACICCELEVAVTMEAEPTLGAPCVHQGKTQQSALILTATPTNVCNFN